MQMAKYMIALAFDKGFRSRDETMLNECHNEMMTIKACYDLNCAHNLWKKVHAQWSRWKRVHATPIKIEETQRAYAQSMIDRWGKLKQDVENLTNVERWGT